MKKADCVVNKVHNYIVQTSCERCKPEDEPIKTRQNLVAKAPELVRVSLNEKLEALKEKLIAVAVQSITSSVDFLQGSCSNEIPIMICLSSIPLAVANELTAEITEVTTEFVSALPIRKFASSLDLSC